MTSTSGGCSICVFFFFNDTATTEIYTLSLHDALPICREARISRPITGTRWPAASTGRFRGRGGRPRSEEHTSELQSQSNLVCRLLLEKKKKNDVSTPPHSCYPKHTNLTLSDPRYASTH